MIFIYHLIKRKSFDEMFLCVYGATFNLYQESKKYDEAICQMVLLFCPIAVLPFCCTPSEKVLSNISERKSDLFRIQSTQSRPKNAPSAFSLNDIYRWCWYNVLDLCSNCIVQCF